MANLRRPRLAVLAIGLSLSILVAAALVAVPVFAQAPADSPTPVPEVWNPFTLHPSQPGAIPWERHSDLPPEPVPPGTTVMSAEQYEATSREPKASVEAAQDFVELTTGPAVRQAWADYGTRMAEVARTREAEYAAGLSNIENVGVVP